MLFAQEKFRRCFVQVCCSPAFDFSQFSIPFERFNGEYSIKFMACAISQDSSLTEIYMETDSVRRGTLIRRFANVGCKGAIVHTFSRNDAARLAEKFYGRVLAKPAMKPGTILFTRGTPSIEPVVDRAPGDYEVWKRELAEMERREKMVVVTYEEPGSDEEAADGGYVFPRIVGSVRQLTGTTEVYHSVGGKRRMVETSEADSRELVDKAEELECIAGVLDARVGECHERLEACEAARVAEGEALRAELAEQRAEYEAQLEAAAVEHRALVVAKEAAWETRFAAKVLELLSLSGGGGSADLRAEGDARVAAVVAKYEARLATNDVVCCERLAAKEHAHALIKDTLDAKKVHDLLMAHELEMAQRLQKQRIELADERRLAARMRAELATAQGRVDELEEAAGTRGGIRMGRREDGSSNDGMMMRGAAESARNQTLKDLLVNASAMRHSAWLERDKARDEVKELEAKLDDKNREMENEVARLQMEIRGQEFVIADEKQMRRRAGRGDIFHEDGKVLVKCSKCSEVRFL